MSEPRVFTCEGEGRIIPMTVSASEGYCRDEEVLYEDRFVRWQAYARLKAEVERLEKEVWRMKVFKGIDEDTKTTLKDALNTVPEWAKVLETIENNAQLKTENARLKAEVERLTKAGDEMALCFNCPTCAKAWHAAKQGGQP